ncbi:MAG TPA: preprotein translocase subunit SecG [Dehalococcoidia bacterium]|nr:preprotein translocase subunit SecG [Dehalococcoidia bacterium]
MEFVDYVHIAQILVAIALSLVILLQAKGSDVGGIFGGGSSGGGSFRTRRGIEKTLFQMTIVLAIVFLIVSAWSVQQTTG